MTYETRVLELEVYGLCTSDAQSVADAEEEGRVVRGVSLEYEMTLAGEDPKTVSMFDLCAANPDSIEMLETLGALELGATHIEGGGASPAVTFRRAK